MSAALGALIQAPFIWFLIVLAVGAATIAFLDSKP